MELIEKLKRSLATELKAAFTLQQNLMKRSLTAEVQKMTDKAFNAMTFRMDRSCEHIVTQSLNQLEPSYSREDELHSKQAAKGEGYVDLSSEGHEQVETIRGSSGNATPPKLTIVKDADEGGKITFETSSHGSVKKLCKIMAQSDGVEEHDKFTESDFENDDLGDGDDGSLNMIPPKIEDGNDQQQPTNSPDSITQNVQSFNRKRTIPKVPTGTTAEMTNLVSSPLIQSGIRCTTIGCDVTSDCQETHRLHLLAVHGINPYLCVHSGCCRSFANSYQMAVHLETTHKDLSRWVCKDCHQASDSFKKLMNHYNGTHLNRVFRCAANADCNFTASSRRLVVHHLQVVHQKSLKELKATGALAKQCPYTACGKVFLTAANLRTHLRFHTRSKAFGCSWPQCGYRSEDQGNVVRHIRARHFRVPATLKRQREKGIVCDQDARQWLQMFNESL